MVLQISASFAESAKSILQPNAYAQQLVPSKRDRHNLNHYTIHLFLLGNAKIVEYCTTTVGCTQTHSAVSLMPEVNPFFWMGIPAWLFSQHCFRRP
jgi:hypothetical protein